MNSCLRAKTRTACWRAVTGPGAFSTEFVTGCENENGTSAGYGVSITVSLETLYKKNGGKDNPANPVKLDKDENGQPFYEADFILREKDYPINMVYMQERYALHVAVENAQGADYVTVVDDYQNKGEQHNSIKNILGEMTYLTVAKYGTASAITAEREARMRFTPSRMQKARCIPMSG